MQLKGSVGSGWHEKDRKYGESRFNEVSLYLDESSDAIGNFYGILIK